MRPEPVPEGSGFVDFTVVGHHREAVQAPGRISLVQEIQQVQKRSGPLPKPQAVLQLAWAPMQSSGPIPGFVLAGCHDLLW